MGLICLRRLAKLTSWLEHGYVRTSTQISGSGMYFSAISYDFNNGLVKSIDE